VFDIFVLFIDVVSGDDAAVVDALVVVEVTVVV
jgi:hypothetical protein